MDRGYLLELGYLVRGTDAELRCEDDGNPTLQAEVWRFDTEAFKEFYEKMDQNPVNLTELTDTKLAGTIHAGRDDFMYTRVFHMIKAGKLQWMAWKQKQDRFLIHFWLPDLTEGDHEITLTYEPQGLKQVP